MDPVFTQCNPGFQEICIDATTPVESGAGVAVANSKVDSGDIHGSATAPSDVTQCKPGFQEIVICATTPVKSGVDVVVANSKADSGDIHGSAAAPSDAVPSPLTGDGAILLDLEKGIAELKSRKRLHIGHMEARRAESAADELECMLMHDYEEHLPLAGSGWYPPWEPRYSSGEMDRLRVLRDLGTSEAEAESDRITEGYVARERASYNTSIRDENLAIDSRNAKRAHVLDVMLAASRKRHKAT